MAKTSQASKGIERYREPFKCNTQGDPLRPCGIIR